MRLRQLAGQYQCNWGPFRLQSTLSPCGIHPAKPRGGLGGDGQSPPEPKEVDDLRGAVAVVLGAENPLGARLAAACLERGMQVVVDAQPPAPWSGLVQLVPTDLTCAEQVEALAQVASGLGPVRLILNATRMCRGGNAWDTEWSEWRRVLDLHLGGCLNLCRAFSQVHRVTVCWTDPAEAPFWVAQRAVLALQQNLFVSTPTLPTHVLFVDGRAPEAGLKDLFTGLARGQFSLRAEPHLQSQMRSRLASILEPESDQVLPPLEAGRVAVITGAAGGIGLALARACLSRGMKVVLSDLHHGELERAAQDLPAADILCVPADVARAEQVEALAQAAVERFGAVHLLVNNAGVGAGGAPLECTPNDWDWVLGVNLWGVVAAVKVFVPLMLSQGQPAHILNTASLAGLLAYHPSACYHVSKQAVVALSESLEQSLQGTCIGVSVLCPGYVNTRILNSARNRPLHLQDGERPPPRHLRLLQAALRRGMAPEEVAERALEELGRGRFYLFTHPEMLGGVEENLRDLLEQRNPRNPNRLGGS